MIEKKLVASGFFLIWMTMGSAVDPSSVAAESPVDPELFSERWRVLVDLDGDGVNDMILSEATTLFGKMGGAWTVYLMRGKEFTEVGEITAHPKAISIEADHGRIYRDVEKKVYARIWVYLRGGGSEGSYGYFRVKESEVEELESLKIYPGDGGTKLGNALYRATFEESEIPFCLEFSETTKEGKVVWKRPGD